VCVILCTAFRLIVALFCVMCVICVLCLSVVPLPPGENPCAVKINNNKKIVPNRLESGGDVVGCSRELKQGCLSHGCNPCSVIYGKAATDF
jgi:hypothetical protein